MKLTGVGFGREALRDSSQSERAYGLLIDLGIVVVDGVEQVSPSGVAPYCRVARR